MPLLRVREAGASEKRITVSAAEKLDQVTREIHPRPDTVSARVRYVIGLMVDGRYERGITSRELAADWELSVKSTEEYASQASRHLELLGSREHVLQLVRAHAAQWVAESGGDRVPASKLLLETVGGLVQRHEHKHEGSQRSDSELFVMMLSEVRADPVLRAKAIAFLTAEQPDVALLTAGESVDE